MHDQPWMDLSDKTVVVTGAASGIGAATVDALVAAGASVHALDIAPVATAVAQVLLCDLGDSAAIDGAVAVLPQHIDMLMNCAGVPNGGRFSPEEVMAVNWFGLRHLSEALLPRIPATGSITHVASTAGRAWADNEALHRSFMQATTFDEGRAIAAANAETIGDGYSFSKQAVQYYTMWRGLQIREHHDVRMNSLCPGVTDTQLSQDFRRGVGADVIDRAISVAGRLAKPAEMAPTMLFLGDHRTASYINGVNLNVDRGTGAAHSTGAF